MNRPGFWGQFTPVGAFGGYDGRDAVCRVYWGCVYVPILGGADIGCALTARYFVLAK